MRRLNYNSEIIESTNKLLSPANFMIKKFGRIGTVFIVLIFLTLVSGLYLRFAWLRYQNTAESEAIMLAQSLESVLHREHLFKLSGSEEDLGKEDYEMTKRSLIELVETTNPIRFAYFMGKRNGNIVILMDSEPSDSVDYSPPGQIYEEADETLWNTFRSDQTVLTKPTTDRWGTWISALVPIKDPINGKIVAVFGIDYSASKWQIDLWKQMIPDVMIVICLLLIFIAWLHSLAQQVALKKLSNKVAFNEALYHSIFDQAPIGIAIVNDKNFVTQSEFGYNNMNSMFELILGRKSKDLANISWPEITHPKDLHDDLVKFEQLKTGKISGYSMEKRFLRPDGFSIWTSMTISSLSDLPTNQSLHLCLIEDITQRKEAEKSLRESERSKSVLISNIPGMAYSCKYDRDWTMQFVSAGCLKLTGYASESLINNKVLSFNDLITPEYCEPLWKEWERVLTNRLSFNYEYEIMTANGDRKWVLELGEGVFNENGDVEALEGIILDISDRKEFENNLRYINEHDGWTGLYNRDYLELILEKDSKMQNTFKSAVISINLNEVQSLTATYGFHYTQNLIKEAAERLNQYCTDTRLLFRTYESRFVFYLKDYVEKSELIEFSNAIAETLELIFVTDRISGGIGILEIDTNDELDVDLILKKLLIASEKSISIFEKDFRTSFYDDDLEAEIKREGEIRQELSRLASDANTGELYVQYQPILDLKTDSICGFEALARFKTEKLGLVSPIEFIPIAEKTKLIIPIGEKIMIDAFHFSNRLKAQGFDAISVSINVSAIQLLRPEFSDRLLELINEMQVNPKNIGIEITESVFASDYGDINNIINKLRNSGLHILIDDFGTGYSSLARENELSVDYLKIDKYFIDKLLQTDPDKAITGDIISMAHRLGHSAIAEGVEYEEQKQYLMAHGCDKIQGYLVAKPLDEDVAIELLSKQIVLNNGCL